MSLHIETVGRGPALVLIHGWALHGGVFEPLVGQLSGRFSLHLVDLPGHGRSRDPLPPLALADVVHEVSERTPPAVWLGWSLGGLFALRAAALKPNVRGLAMLAATPRFVRGQDWPDAIDAGVLERFCSELQGNFGGTVDRFLELDTLGSAEGSARLQQLRELLLVHGEPDAQALEQGMHLLQQVDLRGLLPGLPVPSLWLAGRRDRLVPPAAMRAAAAMAPRSRFVEFAAGAHAPFIGHAAQIAAELARFAEGLPA